MPTWVSAVRHSLFKPQTNRMTQSPYDMAIRYKFSGKHPCPVLHLKQNKNPKHLAPRTLAPGVRFPLYGYASAKTAKTDGKV